MKNVVCFLSLSLILLGSGELWAAGRNLAVVIGVGTYRTNSGLPSLGQAPVNDAANLSKVLRQQGYPVYEMTHAVAKEDGQELMAPNIAYIRDQIDGVLGFPNLGVEDSVIISLHGHGVQFEQVDDEGDKTPCSIFVLRMPRSIKSNLQTN